MVRRKLFLRWSLLATLIAVGAIIAGKLGWFDLAWRFDSTRITFFILALFAATTAYLGLMTWRADGLVERKKAAQGGDVSTETREIELAAENAWVSHDYCEKLGLLGTLVGLVMVLIRFASYNSSDPAALGRLMEHMAVGLGTAYITTIAGLVCSILLSLQLKHLERALERLKP